MAANPDQRQVADASGHRRGRIHRLECGRGPQRGRADRHRRQRRARHRRQVAQSCQAPGRRRGRRRPICSRWLEGRKLDAVIHMGAISDTTATDADLVMENNFRSSLRLLDWCTGARVPFIYASSAATYGDGAEGFDDDWSPAGAAKAQADEPLRLEQAAVRPGRGRALREEGEAAAAMGGAEVLQRVRPERVSQGRDDEPRRQALRRRQGRPHRAAVQVAPRRASAMASSGATSSTSTMRSPWCAG